MSTDEIWMRLAIQEAYKARESDEVPVGAVVVCDNQVVGKGHNRPITDSDPTAHAELIALRAAAVHLKNYRLPGCTLYVTLEPCQMCAGAMVHARIDRLVYAVRDVKTGAVESRFNALQQEYLNHRVDVTSGVMELECSTILSSFFREKRKQKS